MDIEISKWDNAEINNAQFMLRLEGRVANKEEFAFACGALVRRMWLTDREIEQILEL